VTTPKNPQNDGLYARPSIKQKDVAATRSHSLMASVGESEVVDNNLRLVDHGVMASEERNLILLQQFLHDTASPRKLSRFCVCAVKIWLKITQNTAKSPKFENSKH